MQSLENLSSQQYQDIFDNIIDRKISDDQIKKLLLDLNQIDFPTNAFLGALLALRSRCDNDTLFPDAIDVCGTGGDKLNTLNISTAVAIVIAACGVKVVKHGNKAISSKSGSADVLSELGFDIMADCQKNAQLLQRNNLCFMFAPLYHKSFKNLSAIRLELGAPTIFNFLGPLLNPARALNQLIGTSRKSTMLPMIQALKVSGSKKVFIVCGMDGMDEITISDNSFLIKLENGEISDEEIINPEKYGIRKSPLSTILGGDAKYNASKIIDLLNGEESAYFDIVVLNAAFALMVAEKVKSVEDGILLAKNTIISGNAKRILNNMC